MGENGKAKDFLGVVKNLGEIGGYVAAIVAYVLAISGRSPTPYPVTVSFLTVLVTVIVVGVWRWPKITEKKRKNNSKSKKDKSQGEDIFDFIRSHGVQPYQRSLLQRRLETVLLSGMLVGVLILGFINVSYMQEEVTGLNCLNPSSDFRVMITNFTFSPEQHFENKLGNALARQAKGLYQVCRYMREVNFDEEVELTRARYEMDLVIWGSYSDEQYEVAYSATPDFAYIDTKGTPVDDTDEEVAFLTVKTTATIYFVQDNIGLAQETLQNALEIAREQDWALENPSPLADGYFLLALILEAKPVDDLSALTPAINAYSQAIEQDLTYEAAYWNRALLYMDQGNIEKALEDFDALIALNKDLTLDARQMKAEIFLQDGDCDTAKKLVEEVLSTPGVDETIDLYTDLVFTLGKAHLICGEFSDAEEAFGKMPALNTEFVPVYTDELKNMVEDSNNPELKEEIAKIILMIQSKQSP